MQENSNGGVEPSAGARKFARCNGIEREDSGHNFVSPTLSATNTAEEPLTVSGAMRMSALRQLSVATPSAGSRVGRFSVEKAVEDFLFQMKHWLVERKGFAGQQARKQELVALTLAMVSLLVLAIAADHSSTGTNSAPTAELSSGM
jgi:hypothetical protein